MIHIMVLLTDEEVFFEHTNSTPEDEEFDAIVSALEEILQDDAFQAQLSSFYQNHCGTATFLCSLATLQVKVDIMSCGSF